jgi:hypothetical protein
MLNERTNKNLDHGCNYIRSSNQSPNSNLGDATLSNYKGYTSIYEQE